MILHALVWKVEDGQSGRKQSGSVHDFFTAKTKKKNTEDKDDYIKVKELLFLWE